MERPPRPPQLSTPTAGRQGARIAPQFRQLQDAFDQQRVTLETGPTDEIDPELVVVFDLAGTVEGFRSAAEKAGLRFLTEQLDEKTEADDDFHYVDWKTGAATDDSVTHSLYAVMTNATALDQLVRLFDSWKSNPNEKLEHGLGRFKLVFSQLRAVRRWDATDRVKDTGLIGQWQERLDLVGGSYSPEIVEIELWYRRAADERSSAESALRQIVDSVQGTVIADAHIPEIAYHALLVQLPVQQVQRVLERGATSVRLLNADQIMFVSPYRPMTVRHEAAAVADRSVAPGPPPTESLPRIALFDGLPFGNHDHLSGRLIIDDPDSVGGGGSYPVSAQRHGTTMASLIIHGDLTVGSEPITRPLYCRPILEPERANIGERFLRDSLLPDVLHRAVRRLFEPDGHHPPAAPSVRIVNLSIGSAAQALIRRVSPAGRLLDWLALKYNVLFIVSAGNHTGIALEIPSTSIGDLDLVKVEAVKAARNNARLRGIMPPGDALNVLTVGATHNDSADVELPDTVWDVTGVGAPSLYGAVGPGLNRSVKPEVHHIGGRSVYVRPIDSGSPTITLVHAPAAASGPGTLSAAPGFGGSTSSLEYSHGTSNATALVTREANRIFDVLEGASASNPAAKLPDPQFYPVLTKALLVHATSWSEEAARLQGVFGFDPYSRKRHLTALLGYGHLDTDRIARGAGHRAVLVAGSSIGRDERHTYSLPFPQSLRAKAEWHRVTVTLTSLSPTAGELTRYRTAKVFFRSLTDDIPAVGSRAEADYHAVRRGTCQHEIFESSKPFALGEGDVLPIHVECQSDAQTLAAGVKIRYALVVSIETAAGVSTTIHQEVSAGLQARVQERNRSRLRAR